MKKRFDWDGTIDSIQFGLLWFIIIVVVICVSVLILFDVLAGAGVMNYLTNQNTLASFLISLATSGLLVSLMFLSYNFGKGKSTFSVGFILGTIAFGVYCLDVYFDSMTADYLRFGQIMILKDIPNSSVQLLFRLLIGGISTVGESLAMAIIVGMPVLKEIINKAVPEGMRTQVTTSSNNNSSQNRSQQQNQSSYNNNGGGSHNHNQNSQQRNQAQSTLMSNIPRNSTNQTENTMGYKTEKPSQPAMDNALREELMKNIEAMKSKNQ